MKVLNFEEYDDESLLSINNGNETFNFAHIDFMHEDGEYKLIEYFRNQDKYTKLSIIGSLEDKSLICVNNNSSRAIEMDDDGYVTKDVIRYNQRGQKQKIYYNNQIPNCIKINDYLSIKSKMFINNQGEYLNNDFLLDEDFMRFLESDAKYKGIIKEVMYDAKNESEELTKNTVKKLELKLNQSMSRL